jgi:hypothetical protein
MGSLAKMALCAVAMAAVAYRGLRVSHFSAAGHVMTQAASLAAVILASTAAYFGLAWLLRCKELPEFLLLLRRAESGTAPLAQGEI